MKITTKTFDELSTQELYDIMALRSEIFVVEQDCAYQDLDYLDQQSLHVLGQQEGKIIAYTRVVPMGLSYDDYVAIGRVVVDRKHRGQNLGYDIMNASNELAIENYQQPIKISAQVYVVPFYEKLGYIVVGEEYLEDGIPHTAMILKS
jgi:ElaA protein